MISWNVNGIRAVEKKGFVALVKDLSPDIFAIQETKAQPDQLSRALHEIDGYTSYWHSAVRKGYSGVALYTRPEPLPRSNFFIGRGRALAAHGRGSRDDPTLLASSG